MKIIRVIHFALKWFAVRHISQIYDDPGIFPGKFLQTHGQKLIGIIDRSDRKPSLCTLMQLSDGEGAFFRGIQDLLRVWQKRPSLLSQANVPFRAVEKLDSKLLLKIVDLTADGRLRHAVLSSRIGKIQYLTDRDKTFYLI